MTHDALDHGKFNHPYTPYYIQLQFMNELYDALENHKIGIFESPTGTGKTLSLICASMTWLREHRANELRKSLEDLDLGDEPDWIKEEAKEMKKKEFNDRVLEFESKLKEIRKIEEQERAAAHSKNERPVQRKKLDTEKASEESFLLDDYTSDNEGEVDKEGYSAKVKQLLDQMGKEAAAANEEEDVYNDQVKIYFASRTHSQLSQFIGQLKMTKFPAARLDEDVDLEPARSISLSSRQQLCIHKKVSKLRDVTHKNEACMDMQKKESTRCEFMLNPHKLQDKVRSIEFRDRVIGTIRDIEDLAELGKTMAICPYYETRRAVPMSEIVTLPYQLLIQRQARQALGIDLKGSVVIIDEAHNVIDTITSLFSLSISVNEAERATRGLQIYYDKFSKRLNGANKIYLQQLLKVVGGIEQFLKSASEKPIKETMPGKEVAQDTLLGDSGRLVNMHKLEKYLQKSKLAFKIESYLESREEHEEVSNLVLTKVVTFLLAVTNPSSEGKVFYARTESKKLQLQYMLLDPSAHFKEIVDEARCVILAGGTMEPVGDYLNYLFPYVEKSDIKLFSCGHVIPDTNLAVSTLATGPSRRAFSFTFAHRKSAEMHEELGKTIFNLTAVVPAGMVVFFPSYQYLDDLISSWQKSKLLDRMSTRKKIFMEPREASVDSVLTAYKLEIETNGGALLFSVVGGKMSEGINFSDDLARCVVMVGLPFPNLMSAEMVAKRDFIESKVLATGGSKQQAAEATRDFYENICMRAVNQSIGRAIRHRNDYASIVLIDERYDTDRIRRKLPNWISHSISAAGGAGTFPACIQTLGAFFRSKKL